jgi:hypothetical protein
MPSGTTSSTANELSGLTRSSGLLALDHLPNSSPLAEIASTVSGSVIRKMKSPPTATNAKYLALLAYRLGAAAAAPPLSR